MSQPIWPADDLRSAFSRGEMETGVDVTGVSIDSRSIQPGDLFIALSGDPGPRFGGGNIDAGDGHNFVAQAIESGAAAVMVHRDMDVPVPVIRVNDTLDGLWQLGRFSRSRTQAQAVAITGSSGKTTLRSWLELALGAVARCHASEGSLNNHWGVPLSLSRMPADSEIGLFEIGTNHPGEIAPLAKLVAPDVAVVLNVLPAHIGNFEGMAALTDEKLSIAEGLVAGGTLVLPVGLAGSSAYSDGQVVTFGPGGDVSVEFHNRESGMLLDVDMRGTKVQCKVPFRGQERADSVAALFAIVSALNVDPATVAGQLASLSMPEGRGNERQLGGVTVIDDSYNANPVSMKMSLSRLRDMESGGRKYALLGEMLELGDGTRSAHEDVADMFQNVGEVLTFGEGFVGIRGASHFIDAASFDLEAFASQLRPGDVVLVKGSNRVFWKNNFVTRLCDLITKKG